MKKDTRTLFIQWLIKKARKDKKIMLLIGDLGFNFVEPFKEEFPDRFINCGVAEQNMIGVATGLVLAGWKPYCYSGIVFLNYKCSEQIRDAWMQDIDINVVATRVGQFLGFTHNIQDGETQPLEQLSKLLKKEKNYIRL